MNVYKKYCPNVFVAQCEEEYQKGDIITVTAKYGKENEHIVHNLVAKKDNLFFYSITRVDGFNSQERAQNKADKLSSYAESAARRSEELASKADEGKEFLSMGEPVKVGHHSEKRHRALFERNWKRMESSINESEKAKSYESRISYWENLAKKVDLSMPESFEFFKAQLKEAKAYHKGLKDGTIKREHSYSLTYAKKKCNDLEKKVKIASVLWS